MEEERHTLVLASCIFVRNMPVVHKSPEQGMLQQIHLAIMNRPQNISSTGDCIIGLAVGAEWNLFKRGEREFQWR